MPQRVRCGIDFMLPLFLRYVILKWKHVVFDG